MTMVRPERLLRERNPGGRCRSTNGSIDLDGKPETSAAFRKAPAGGGFVLNRRLRRPWKYYADIRVEKQSVLRVLNASRLTTYSDEVTPAVEMRHGKRVRRKTKL